MRREKKKKRIDERRNCAFLVLQIVMVMMVGSVKDMEETPSKARRE